MPAAPAFQVFGSAADPATLAFTGAGFSQNDGTFELFNITPLTLSNAFTNSATGTFQLGATAPLRVTGNDTNGGALYVDVGDFDGGGKSDGRWHARQHQDGADGQRRSQCRGREHDDSRRTEQCQYRNDQRVRQRQRSGEAQRHSRY